MRNGLYAVVVWQGGGSPVLRVGWFRRDSGDEWQCWWVTPYRGEYTTKLSDVWTEGPGAAKAWKWGPVLESYVSRLHLVPLAVLEPEKWKKVCPRPEGWDA